jgi:hypothetical protein
LTDLKSGPSTPAAQFNSLLEFRMQKKGGTGGLPPMPPEREGNRLSKRASVN